MITTGLNCSRGSSSPTTSAPLRGACVLRIEFQCLPKLQYRFIHPAAIDQSDTQVVVGVGKLGLSDNASWQDSMASSNWPRLTKASPKLL